MNKVLLAVAAAAAFISVHAQAATLTIHATSVTTGITDFDLTFDDTGDGLLQLAEVTLFSGFSVTGSGAGVDGTYTGIAQVANISGIAAGGGGNLWTFNGNPANSGLQAHIARWTYGFVTNGSGEGAAPVPEPAVWTLMIAAFGALGLAMRRRLRPV